MAELLLHPNTRRDIERLLAHPRQSLLITGKAGSGTHMVARSIAQKLLDTSSLEKHPYFLHIGEDEKTISIDQIRELQQFLKLKVTGNKAAINRIIVIEKAGRMGTEAQNALLKTLEEPPVGSCIILTAQSTEELLGTITSRTSLLPILPISLPDAQTYFASQNVAGQELARAFALSGGNAGLLTALIRGEQTELTRIVSLAKEILSEPAGKRLLRSDELAKDKLNVQALLDGLYRICHAGLHAAATKKSEKAIRQWQARESRVIDTMHMHQKNANTKLMLDALFLSL